MRCLVRAPPSSCAAAGLTSAAATQAAAARLRTDTVSASLSRASLPMLHQLATRTRTSANPHALRHPHRPPDRIPHDPGRPRPAHAGVPARRPGLGGPVARLPGQARRAARRAGAALFPLRLRAVRWAGRPAHATLHARGGARRPARPAGSVPHRAPAARRAFGRGLHRAHSRRGLGPAGRRPRADGAARVRRARDRRKHRPHPRDLSARPTSGPGWRSTMRTSTTLFSAGPTPGSCRSSSPGRSRSSSPA